MWPDDIVAGHIHQAVLVHRAKGSARGTARLDNGQDVLVDRLPAQIAEGAGVSLTITRSAIGERGRTKLPLGRISHDAPRQPSLADMLRSDGSRVREVRAFPDIGWSDLVGDACTGSAVFQGGMLLIDPTPAMTVIDVDGTGDARNLALAAVAPIAGVLRRFDIGGVVGVDFPTMPAKTDRRAVDDALAAALHDFPHERTAMNGFGFVQIVSSLRRPSLVHRASLAHGPFAARQLLRQAEGIAGAGAILLTMHPALQSHIKPQWRAELARRTGREIRMSHDPGLALEGGFAQSVAL